MYFSRNEFIANIEVQNTAVRNAKEAVRYAREYFGKGLDGTRDSLETLESIFRRISDQLRPSGYSEPMVQPFAGVFGDYLGEVIRTGLGGEWGYLRVYSDYVPAVRTGERGIVITPIAIAERFIRGEETGTVEQYYARVARAIDEKGALGEKPGLSDPKIDRLYTLRDDQGYFETGTISDGRRVLTSPFWDGGVVIFFGQDGALLGHEVREAHSDPETALEQWEEDVDFCAEPIHIQRFEIPEFGIGIGDLPSHYQEFLESPEFYEPDVEAREELATQVREWQARGDFVLYWGNDLWLDAEGNVTSS